MTVRARPLLAAALLLLVLAGAGLVGFLRHGVSARDQPWRAEILVARRLRHLAIPRAAREAINPVAPSAAALTEARAHFADHCASCHANDGSGQTPLGRNLFPKAPDMRTRETQDLSDGEIFAIIANGIRFTGMPAWGDGSAASDRQTWALVHFVRALPRLTPAEIAEMERMNPRSPAEVREEMEAERFLSGEPD